MHALETCVDGNRNLLRSLRAEEIGAAHNAPL
jgi:hypothetical protein